MNFAALFKAVDAVIAFRDAAKRFKSPAAAPPPDATLAQPAAAQGLTGQIEARLTNVVVAALKEAFDRDHARLELEREQLEEDRRRAEATLRLELWRQAGDREIARLRLLAGTAMIGWIASIAIVAGGLVGGSGPSRVALALAWLLLLGALGTAFLAQGRVNAAPPDDNRVAGAIGTASLWLLLAGLAAAAISLLL